MNRTLTRLVALLLIPCLIAETVPASAWTTAPAALALHSVANPAVFEEAALQERLGTIPHAMNRLSTAALYRAANSILLTMVLSVPAVAQGVKARQHTQGERASNAPQTQLSPTNSGVEVDLNKPDIDLAKTLLEGWKKNPEIPWQAISHPKKLAMSVVAAVESNLLTDPSKKKKDSSQDEVEPSGNRIDVTLMPSPLPSPVLPATPEVKDPDEKNRQEQLERRRQELKQSLPTGAGFSDAHELWNDPDHLSVNIDKKFRNPPVAVTRGRADIQNMNPDAGAGSPMRDTDGPTIRATVAEKIRTFLESRAGEVFSEQELLRNIPFESHEKRWVASVLGIQVQGNTLQTGVREGLTVYFIKPTAQQVTIDPRIANLTGRLMRRLGRFIDWTPADTASLKPLIRQFFLGTVSAIDVAQAIHEKNENTTVDNALCLVVGYGVAFRHPTEHPNPDLIDHYLYFVGRGAGGWDPEEVIEKIIYELRQSGQANPKTSTLQKDALSEETARSILDEAKTHYQQLLTRVPSSPALSKPLAKLVQDAAERLAAWHGTEVYITIPDPLLGALATTLPLLVESLRRTYPGIKKIITSRGGDLLHLISQDDLQIEEGDLPLDHIPPETLIINLWFTLWHLKPKPPEIVDLGFFDLYRKEIQGHFHDLAYSLFRAVGLKTPSPELPLYPRPAVKIDGYLVNPHGKGNGVASTQALAMWAAIIQGLLEGGHKVYLSSGNPEDPWDVQRTYQLIESLTAAGIDPTRYSVVDLPVKDLMAFLPTVRGLITLDSGLFHLARLWHIPTLVLVTPSSVEWIPESSEKDTYRTVALPMDRGETSTTDTQLTQTAEQVVEGIVELAPSESRQRDEQLVQELTALGLGQQVSVRALQLRKLEPGQRSLYLGSGNSGLPIAEALKELHVTVIGRTPLWTNPEIDRRIREQGGSLRFLSGDSAELAGLEGEQFDHVTAIDWQVPASAQSYDAAAAQLADQVLPLLSSRADVLISGEQHLPERFARHLAERGLLFSRRNVTDASVGSRPGAVFSWASLSLLTLTPGLPVRPMIRAADPADIEAVKILRDEVYRPAVGADRDTRTVEQLAAFAAGSAGGNATGIIFVADVAGEIVGYTAAVFSRSPLAGLLNEIAVVPSHQHSGIDVQLMEEVSRWLLEREPTLPFVATQIGSAAGKGFLKKIGGVYDYASSSVLVPLKKTRLAAARVGQRTQAEMQTITEQKGTAEERLIDRLSGEDPRIVDPALAELNQFKDPSRIHALVTSALQRRRIAFELRNPLMGIIIRDLNLPSADNAVGYHGLVPDVEQHRLYLYNISLQDSYRGKRIGTLLYDWLATEPTMIRRFAGWQMGAPQVYLSRSATQAWLRSGFFQATAEPAGGNLFKIGGIFPDWSRWPSAASDAEPKPKNLIVAVDKIDVSGLGISGVIDLSKETDKIAKLIELNPVILIVRSATKVTPELMDQLPNLKAIIRGGHGTDNIDVEYAAKKGIEVHKTGGSEDPVSDLVMRMLARATPGQTRAEADEVPDSFYPLSEWNQALDKKIEAAKSDEQKALLREKGIAMLQPLSRTTVESLRGRTLGLIGYGSIGQKIAEKAKALGMEVLAYSPSLEQDPQAAQKAGYQFATQEEIYGHAHFVVPMMGLTKTGPRKNLHFLDDQAVDILLANPNLIAVVNADREDLVDENAIVRLLTQRPEAQYLVDEEPANAELKRRALYTPHIGASTPSGEKYVVAATARTLKTLYERLAGSPIVLNKNNSSIPRDPKKRFMEISNGDRDDQEQKGYTDILLNVSRADHPRSESREGVGDWFHAPQTLREKGRSVLNVSGFVLFALFHNPFTYYVLGLAIATTTGILPQYQVFEHVIHWTFDLGIYSNLIPLGLGPLYLKFHSDAAIEKMKRKSEERLLQLRQETAETDPMVHRGLQMTRGLKETRRFMRDVNSNGKDETDMTLLYVPWMIRVRDLFDTHLSRRAMGFVFDAHALQIVRQAENVQGLMPETQLRADFALKNSDTGLNSYDSGLARYESLLSRYDRVITKYQTIGFWWVFSAYEYFKRARHFPLLIPAMFAVSMIETPIGVFGILLELFNPSGRHLMKELFRTLVWNLPSKTPGAYVDQGHAHVDRLEREAA